MPVTFPVAARAAETVKLNYERPTNNDAQVLEQLQTTYTASKVFQSSMDRTKDIVVMKSGFVRGALMAYSYHHNLVIRPDDVWIAIMAQLSIYIDKHAEELRDKFVAHSGKKALVVVSKSTTLGGMDFGELAVEMTDKIKDNVKDQSLVPWALPNFSTSTPNDTIICSVLLMATLKQYFSYTMLASCGIPFITIEGTQTDWQLVLERLDKLAEFGAEPAEWADMLRVIVHRFIRAFNVGGAEADIEFWKRSIDIEFGSGMEFISGWMSAFCAWNNKGVFFAAGREKLRGLTFDGVSFPQVMSTPDAFAEVDVKVIDEYDVEHDCTMAAGHVGIFVGGESQDTIQMAPQWFMFEKGIKRVG